MREATRRMAGAPAVEDCGMTERKKACESSPPNVDVVRNVQSLGIPVSKLRY